MDLYQEQVVVSQNASQKEQNEAIQSSFARLLVRVTGITQVLEYPTVIDELKQGSKYLATFRFEPSDVFFTNVLGEKVPTKLMNLTFDKKTVDAFLVQNRLPVWGEKRPDVLFWIADRLEGQDHILADAEESRLATIVAEQTDIRGIPYLLPIMDLTDSLTLSFSELYGLFSQDIEVASERYKPEAILTGRVLAGSDENSYQADWLMLFKGERLRLPTVTGTLDEVIAQGVDLVAQRLSEQYALILDPLMLGNLTLKVSDIQSLGEFAALESYLRTINIITKATVRSFSGTDVEFNVEISGDQSQLQDVLALDGQLSPVEEVSLEAQLDNRLVFQWQEKK
ncbi:DUF2066 domain-containing protein [Reinekea sp. G2M2-21]|uniref:DUF2066 domain-containing protein n=1 Tax=Reinekea sp. G2M2-21 TaxID=2788942 RepID=UPI0018AA9894